jgi:predicted transcriptional regulator
MASRRSKVSIVSEILTACMGGATKNRIVHQANLNFSTVCPYLDNLINKGLIEEVGEGTKTIYKITPKGLGLKKKFEQSRTVVDEIYASE